EPQDGVADDLSRSVVGDRAASIHMIQGNSADSGAVAVTVPMGGLTSSADRVDGVMLEQQKRIGAPVGLPGLDEALLQGPGVLVVQSRRFSEGRPAPSRDGGEGGRMVECRPCGGRTHGR